MLKRRKGEWLILTCFCGSIAIPLSSLRQHFQQVEEHQDIDHQQARTHERDATKDFQDLPGQERGGDSEGHVLGPGLFQVEADALGEAQCSIGKEGHAEAAQHAVIDNGCAVEDEVDEAGFRVEV